MGKGVKDSACRAECEDLAEDNAAKIVCRPFLKWVGGKSQLLPELLPRFPKNVKRYFEPFIGGGAVLFAYQPKLATVVDVNQELIGAYTVVRDDVESLIKDLRRHVHDEAYYYDIRNADRSPSFAKWSAARKAARLIYLNKTCYNGLYRVNSQGFFNTPFGSYVNPTIADADNLRACSRVLQGVEIKHGDFDQIEEQIGPDDFVYFDPPYVPLTATAYFTSYSKNGFDRDMQQSLFELCCRLDRRGIRFMLSNSAAEFVKTLYKKFRVDIVMAARAVNSKGDKRGRIEEVLVTNY